MVTDYETGMSIAHRLQSVNHQKKKMTTREALLELITSATEPTKIVTYDMADKLGVSQNAVFRALKKLVRDGQIKQVGPSLFANQSTRVEEGVVTPVVTPVVEGVVEGVVDQPKPLGPNTLESGRLIDADIPQDQLATMTKAELDEVIASGPERHQLLCLKEKQRRKQAQDLTKLPQGMTLDQFYRQENKEISKKKVDRLIETMTDDPKYADTLGVWAVPNITERKLTLPAPEPKN